MQRPRIITLISLVAIGLILLGCNNTSNPIESTISPATTSVDLSSALPTLTLPQDAVLNSATLYLDVTRTVGLPVSIYRITADWIEGSVTWNNFGGAFDGTTNFGPFTATTTGYLSQDITDLVNLWLSGTPNYGLLLDQAGTDRNDYTQYHSREYTSGSPYLVLEYTSGGSTYSETLLPTADAYIWANYPDNNTGLANYLYSGNVEGKEKQSLIRFDLSQTPPPPPGEESCETAFAYGDDDANCFSDYGFSRWGWTNGPLSEGDYSFDIYAGAGQCDLSKGTVVGTVTVNYDGSTATVTYSLDSGYTLDETHVYVGTDPIPTNKKGKETVAPGQYPYGNHDAEYTVDGLSGDIYVIAHAVVCGDYGNSE